jgi:hypothetical protein
MAVEQVEAMLGMPIAYFESTNSFIWVNGPDVITVTTDPAWKVTSKAYNPPSAWQRLRWHVNELLVRIGIGQE